MAHQDYCDWCMRRPLTIDDRLRSLQLGLPLEDAWACAECIDSGAYREPPDGWVPPAEKWPARDTFILGPGDLLAINNALNEVLHGPDAIECREFHTRMGVSPEEAHATLQRLRKAWGRN